MTNKKVKIDSYELVFKTTLQLEYELVFTAHQPMDCSVNLLCDFVFVFALAQKHFRESVRTIHPT